MIKMIHSKAIKQSGQYVFRYLVTAILFGILSIYSYFSFFASKNDNEMFTNILLIVLTVVLICLFLYNLVLLKLFSFINFQFTSKSIGEDNIFFEERLVHRVGRLGGFILLLLISFGIQLIFHYSFMNIILLIAQIIIVCLMGIEIGNYYKNYIMEEK